MKPKPKLYIRVAIADYAGCTHEQVEEWLRYKIGKLDSMSSDNPLIDLEVEADSLNVARWS